ncbi:MerR family transcriptional regulator [Streptomyces sp. NPDC000594]|uniref:MerR family transcriptional regulator n=1 Tax=Streptomyces sp. NPDC000594 TaxID=3154261 RepID=UPI003319DDC9
MRIGEIADMAGVTPRTVRHYHHQGLLPEPERRANGYRDYGLRHAVLLARIRRLTELGLGLAEVRDVLADEAGRELVEVLAELDADLARDQARIAARRERLAVLIEQAREGRLPAEGPVSEELAGLLGGLGPSDSPIAAKDRAHLTLLDTMVPEDRRAGFFAALHTLVDDPGRVSRTQRLYERLDTLATAGTDDARIEPLAQELAGLMPDELLGLMEDDTGGGPATQGLDGAFGEALLADFAPAQAAVVRRMMELLAVRVAERARRRPGKSPEGGA